ncbi:MAG: sulfur relay protein DsrC [endosymbiont of Galathealinum brachiosum]|uniref:Sulfur relay protein DsrC n=1 Tax=endosymbiont of Galathealinum brachiosum TaxID=2200906 RepID=A0A370D9N5_9GAMM|nr:MAG: sulfur relay protein DsrC [endosymbiont of Galathealinum brachiosum]
MIYLSDILTQEHELETFEGLLEIVRQKARDGEIHLDVDIKPPFNEAPKDWQNQIEMAFTFPNR